MLRRHVVTAVALLAISGGFSQLEAQIDRIYIGPLIGVNFDAEEIYIGAEGWIPLEGVMVGENTVVINPAFMWYPFIGGDSSVGSVDVDASLWSIGADAMLPFEMGGNATPFVKAGLMIQRASVSTNITEGSVSDTEAGLNLAAGSLFGPPDSGKFYGQVGVLIGSSSSVYLQGGYGFPVG